MPYIPCPRCQLLAARWGLVAFCPGCAQRAYYAWAYLKTRNTPRRRRGRQTAAPAVAEPHWTLGDFDDETLIHLCTLRARIRDGAYADDRTSAPRR